VEIARKELPLLTIATNRTISAEVEGCGSHAFALSKNVSK
jgi:hypothetical protein